MNLHILKTEFMIFSLRLRCYIGCIEYMNIHIHIATRTLSTDRVYDNILSNKKIILFFILYYRNPICSVWCAGLWRQVKWMRNITFRIWTGYVDVTIYMCGCSSWTMPKKKYWNKIDPNSTNNETHSVYISSYIYNSLHIYKQCFPFG